MGDALLLAFRMLWQIFWGLALGFTIAAIIEVIVSKGEMARLLPNASPRSLGVASLLGAASSSCSYAAVAMARSIIRKGGDFTAAIAFQFAATNLVLELGVLLWVLLGWQFAAAEFLGGAVMIAGLALLFRLLLPAPKVEAARAQADKGLAGSMEGHAQMAMSAREGRWIDRLTSKQGFIAISHEFVMNWSMLWRDILGGVLIAGALAAWVPRGFWQSFFLVGHPLLAPIWGAFIGPLIALVSFTCSIGNVPLAAVLWNGGISFGGVVAFIFGDLIIIPILLIYRKYYGRWMTGFLFVTSYGMMVVAALLVEGVFALLGATPAMRHATVATASIGWDYTTVLDIVFGAVTLVLFAVFARTGGPKMMRHMAHADTASAGVADGRLERVAQRGRDDQGQGGLVATRAVEDVVVVAHAAVQREGIVRVDLVPLEPERAAEVGAERRRIVVAVGDERVVGHLRDADAALGVDAEAIGRLDREARASAEAVQHVRTWRRRRVRVGGVRDRDVALAEEHGPLHRFVADLQVEPRRERSHVLERAEVRKRADLRLDHEAVVSRRRRWCFGLGVDRLHVVRPRHVVRVEPRLDLWRGQLAGLGLVLLHRPPAPDAAGAQRAQRARLGASEQ